MHPDWKYLVVVHNSAADCLICPAFVQGAEVHDHVTMMANLEHSSCETAAVLKILCRYVSVKVKKIDGTFV